MHPWHCAKEGSRDYREKEEDDERESEQKKNVTTILPCTRDVYKTALIIAREFFVPGLIAGKSDERPICRRLQLLSVKPPTIALPMNDGTLRGRRVHLYETILQETIVFHA